MSLTEKQQRIYSYLSEISDPEIPVINIVEMGVVRDVLFHDLNVQILLTPTYSGCPAMDMIDRLILEKLNSKGFNSVEITLVYKPAWTTDWMTDETKEKLRKYGIAPPVGKTASKKSLLNHEVVSCPQCNSSNTKMKSMFGSTACKALYVCNNCLEPFDYFKCI